MRTFLYLFIGFLMASPAGAATYYVAKTGNDGNSCATAQSIGTPKLTIAGGLGCVGAGDTVIVRAGTYTERLNNAIPSGTAGNPVTLRSEVQYGAIIRPPTQGGLTGAFIISGRQYITLDGIVLDSVNVGNVGFEILTSSHITLQNSDIKNVPYNDSGSGGACIAEADAASFFNVYQNNKIHDCGNNPHSGDTFLIHGLYVHGGNGLATGNEIYNSECHGIHQYSPSGSSDNYTFSNNIVRDNACSGIFISSGDNNTASNNTVYHNGDRGISLGLQGASNNNDHVYNNTIWANGLACFRYGGTSNAIFRNNICYQNGTDGWEDRGGNTGTTADHNLLGTNPLFVDTGSANFHLNTGSPAINTGINVGLPFNGSAPDLGAFESGSAPPPGTLPVPTNLRIGP